MLCGTSLALLALASPVAAQTGVPATESPGNTASGEGSVGGGSTAGGGNSQSGGGAAPVATRDPAPLPPVVSTPRVVTAPAPAATAAPIVRSAPAPAATAPKPDRAAVGRRAAARRAAARRARARRERAEQAAREKRRADARREAAARERADAAAGPVAVVTDAPPEVAPAASKGGGGLSIGTDLTLPLLLLSALGALGLAARHTVRSLRQEQPR